MVKFAIPETPSLLKVNKSKEGETLETKIERIINNKEPIKDGAPLIYTERKAGVNRAYDIRTDRFEVALEATEKIARSYKAKREDRQAVKGQDKDKTKDGEPKSTHGKEGGNTSTDKPVNQ